MKKIIALLMCLVCVFSAFALVACNANDGTAIAGLISDVTLDSLLSGFEIDGSLTIDTQKITAHAAGSIKVETVSQKNSIKANIDGMYSDKEGLYVAVVRNGNIFIGSKELDSNATVTDLVASTKTWLDASANELLPLGNVDTIIDGLLEDTDFTEALAALKELLSGAEVTAVNTIANKLVQNILKIAFNEYSKTSDGFAVSINLKKFVDTVWGKVYDVATYIDGNPKATLTDCLKSKEVKALVTPILDGITGEEIKAVLDLASDVLEEASVTIPDATKGQSAYDYIVSVVDTLKIEGVSVGSLRVEDLLGMLQFEGKLAEILDGYKKTVYDAIDNVVKKCSVTLTFSKQKKFTGIKADLELQIDNTKVAVNGSLKLVSSPSLMDVSSYKDVEGGAIK